MAFMPLHRRRRRLQHTGLTQRSTTFDWRCHYPPHKAEQGAPPGAPKQHHPSQHRLTTSQPAMREGRTLCTDSFRVCDSFSPQNGTSGHLARIPQQSVSFQGRPGHATSPPSPSCHFLPHMHHIASADCTTRHPTPRTSHG